MAEKKLDGQRSVRSLSLDLLRFPLAVIVAVIHVTSSRRFVYDGGVLDVSRMPGADTFFHLIDVFLREQSVPIYFFIAGYVFFLGIDLNLETYRRKLQNRIHSLFIPYVIWNVLALGVSLASAYYFVSIGEFSTLHLRFDYSVTAFLNTFWDTAHGVLSHVTPPSWTAPLYPQDYPLWFVRDLMIIVLCAPGIYLLLKRTSWYAVATLGVSWAVLRAFPMGHTSQLLTGFFFFTWGSYLSFHGKDMIRTMRRRVRPALALYVILTAAMFLLYDSMPKEIYAWLKGVCILAGMVIAYTAAAKLIETGRLRVSRFLSSASFVVYAGHCLLASIVNRYLFLTLHPTNITAAIGCYLLTLIFIVGFFLLLFYISGRYFPALQKLLGGRTWSPSPKRNS